MFLLERLTEVIAPFSCLRCGREGKLVCQHCAGAFCLPLRPRCYRCQTPTSNFAVCGRCAPITPLEHVWVASRLSGLPEALIHTFKFERAQAAAQQIAGFMADALSKLPSNTIIVPIPTATSRVRERGYDHAALLARAVARSRGYAYEKALGRLGQSRQVGATRVQRLAQLQGAFRAARPKVIRGASILLVDDVVTTGASLEQAAKILGRAGARQINGLAFAQK